MIPTEIFWIIVSLLMIDRLVIFSEIRSIKIRERNLVNATDLADSLCIEAIERQKELMEMKDNVLVVLMNYYHQRINEFENTEQYEKCAEYQGTANTINNIRHEIKSFNSQLDQFRTRISQLNKKRV